MSRALGIGLFLFLSLSLSYGQDTFPNTKFLEENQAPAQGSLEDLSWLSGYWKGEAMGGIIEETWTPAIGGSMMCSFKLTVNNEVVFYEFVSLTEENETLQLRLKHFHPNLDGWEDKEDKITWKLVEVTPNKVYFSGFTFEKVDDNHLNIYVVFEEGGKTSEMKFSYQRVAL